MNKKLILTSVLLAIICIGGIVAFLLMKQTSVADPVAEIYVDGALVRTEKLSQEQSFSLTTEYGYNDILIENGSISVKAADCPDKVCVNTGATNSSVVPIICLPHRLEIRIVSAEDAGIDAEIR